MSPDAFACLPAVMFSDTAIGSGIVLLIAWLVSHPRSIFERILNWWPVAGVGVRSYSLYLWQQLFLPPRSSTLVWVIAGLACAFGSAIVSYYALERPALRLRKRLFADASPSGPAI